MNYFDNNDFLKVLKSGALKFPDSFDRNKSYLNEIDFSLLDPESNYLPDPYFNYLKEFRRDILRAEIPILHLIKNCFKEPDLLDAYFQVKEAPGLIKSREKLVFFGPIETSESTRAKHNSRVFFDQTQDRIEGHFSEPILSQFFSHYLPNLGGFYRTESCEIFINSILSQSSSSSVFINIVIDDSNINFFIDSAIYSFIVGLDVLVCFDFVSFDPISKLETNKIDLFFDIYRKAPSREKFFIFKYNEASLPSKDDLEALCNDQIVLYQTSTSDLFIPAYIPDSTVMDIAPNRFYSKSNLMDKFFYFGNNPDLFNSFHEFLVKSLDKLSGREIGTLIYVEQLNIAGTEILSKSFFEFLIKIDLPTILIFKHTGSLATYFDFDQNYFLSLPLGEVNFKSILSQLRINGYRNLITFTSSNLSMVKLAEEVGIRTTIFLNENLKDLELFGVTPSDLFDQTKPQRSIVVNNKSDFDAKFSNLVEITTAIPGNDLANRGNLPIHFSKNDLGLDDQIVVGTLASGVLRKGIDRLQSILDNLPRNMKYLWVGEIDPKFFPNSNNFINVGFMSRDNFYSIIDIYSCLSRNDPFPMSVTEAVLRQIPTVAYGKQSCGQTSNSDFDEVISGDDQTATFIKILTEIVPRKDSNISVKDSKSLLLRIKYSPMIYNAKILQNLKISLPTISVVLPYYNHRQFINKRLETIIDQQIPMRDFIALDDASDDLGFDIIKGFMQNQSFLDSVIIENTTNSGNAFKQWYTGVSNSTSEFIWIAETDDYADSKLILELITLFKDPKVVLAYSNSALVNREGKILSLSNHVFEGIKNPNRYTSNFSNEGPDEIIQAIGIYNSIPNVSACLFKREALMRAFDSLGDYIFNFEYAGDWVVYLELLSHGSLAYDARPLNYFRQHQESIIKSAKQSQLIDEITEVQNFARSKIKFDSSFVQIQKDYLESVKRHFNFF